MTDCRGPYVAIDFETSAFSGACACAIGMARLEDFEVTDTFYSLIRPPSSHVFFTHIHGLKWSDLKDAPSFAQLWPEIAAFLRDAAFLVAHNARFDMNVLESCCVAAGFPMPRQPFLCTLRGARRALKLKSNSLSSVAAYLEIPLNHHHAGSDALACGLIHAALRRRGLPDSAMLLSPAQKHGGQTSFLPQHGLAS